MNLAEYGRMYETEDRYWWFVSRRELVVRLLRRHLTPTSPAIRLLDLGCGTGATSRDLHDLGQVLSLDFSSTALDLCKQRRLSNLVQARAEQIPLRSACTDAVIATDLIEHLANDEATLREIHRVLRPGGHAVVTVPAYQFLWSEHDEALMHHRRYTARHLQRVAIDAGFEIQELNYALCLLFPVALARLLKRRESSTQAARAQLVTVPQWLNSALIRLQRLEAACSRVVRFPFGLSVVAVLRRPERSVLDPSLAPPKYRERRPIQPARV